MVADDLAGMFFGGLRKMTQKQSDPVYVEAAELLGIEAPPDFWMFESSKLTGEVASRRIKVNETRHDNTKGVDYVVLHAPLGLGLRILKNSRLSKVVGVFDNWAEAAFGDSEFTEHVRVETSDRGAVQAMLTPALRAKILELLDRYPSLEVGETQISVQENGRPRQGEQIASVIRDLVDLSLAIAGQHRDGETRLAPRPMDTPPPIVDRAVPPVDSQPPPPQSDRPPADLPPPPMMAQPPAPAPGAPPLIVTPNETPAHQHPVSEPPIVEREIPARKTPHVEAPQAAVPQVDADRPAEVEPAEPVRAVPRSAAPTIAAPTIAVPARSATQPTQPTKPASPAMTGDQTAQLSAIFAEGPLRSRASFDRSFTGRPVEWAGTVRSCVEFTSDVHFGRVSGVRTTVAVGEIDVAGFGTLMIEAVVHFPEDTELNVGDDVSFSGTLLKLDGLTRDIYVANGTVTSR